MSYESDSRLWPNVLNAGPPRNRQFITGEISLAVNTPFQLIPDPSAGKRIVIDELNISVAGAGGLFNLRLENPSNGVFLYFFTGSQNVNQFRMGPGAGLVNWHNGAEGISVELQILAGTINHNFTYHEEDI